MNTYGNDVIFHFHLLHIWSMCFCKTCFLHLEARDPDPGSKSHIFVIFLAILFSYYFHIIVYAWPGPPVNSAIFETLEMPWGPQGSQKTPTDIEITPKRENNMKTI